MDEQTRRLMRERWLSRNREVAVPSFPFAPTESGAASTLCTQQQQQHVGSKRPRRNIDAPSSSDGANATVWLVGRKHHGKSPGGLETGAKVILEREPSNRHDPFAIKVFSHGGDGNGDGENEGGAEKGLMLGYVSGGQASHLSPALDHGDLIVESACIARPHPDQNSTKPNRPLPIALTLTHRGGRVGADALRILNLPFYPPSSTIGSVTEAQRSAAGKVPKGAGGGHSWIDTRNEKDGVDPVAFALAHPPTQQDPERAYVFVHCPPGRYRGCPKPATTGNYTGKWMIMGVGLDELDAYFVEAAKAVAEGEFSAAKAPTGGSRGQKHTGVIIMYTNDFTNQEDVQRAGEAAKKRFGTNREYFYKTDASTLADKYSKRGENTSVYRMKIGGITLVPNEEVLRDDLRLAREVKRDRWGVVGAAAAIGAEAHSWGEGRTLGCTNEALDGASLTMPSEEDQLAWAMRESAKGIAGTAEKPVCLD